MDPQAHVTVELLKKEQAKLKEIRAERAALLKGARPSCSAVHGLTHEEMRLEFMGPGRLVVASDDSSKAIHGGRLTGHAPFDQIFLMHCAPG